MKKRLICMLLTVLMVVSLFAGAGVSASAETVSYSTMTYRMASGDYVLRICQRLDLNYYVCKPAIMKLNNIQEGQWNKLPVGKLLTLPATDADAVVIATGHGSTATAQTAATANTTVAANTTAAATLAATTPSSSATTSASTSGDIVWWWIVPYQLRSGETIADAMNSLGMSVSQYWGTIQKINQIKDWGSARTDTSILLPTVYPPADGFSRVTVYKHRMLASETPANVVTARGLNYTKIKPMLDILNERYGGVANVQTGEWLYYPIASNGKVYGKDRVDGMYSLFSGLSSENGTVEFYVGGERVYQAKAGETVSYVIKPAKGKAVKDIVLKLSNGQGDMYLTGSSFVMPASDVTLDAGFQSGHTITLQSNYEGKASVRVDGVGVDNAAKGAKIMVVSTDPSLAIDELYVNYKTLTGAKREQVTNIDQGFVMPDYDVTVEVVLKPVPTYSLFIMDDNDQRVPALLRPINTNGRFSLEVEGAKVTRAARGAEVKIVPDADTGFTVGQIWVYRHNTNVQIGVFNNTFVMPNVEVDVGVLFVPKGNNIRINPVEGGQFYATIGAADPNPSTIANRDANAVDEAGTNVRVFLNWVPDANQPGFVMSNNPDDFIVTRNNDGLRIPVTMVGGAPSFRMPAGGATVTGGVIAGAQTYRARVYLDGVLIPNGQFKGVSLYTKGDNAAERSEYQDGSGRTTAGLANVPTVVGEYITLGYEGGEKITPASFEVWDAAEANKLAEESDQLDQTGCFKMPNQPVVIRAYFVSETVKLENADVKVTGSGTVGMLGLNADVNAGPTAWNSVSGVKVGQPFAISLSPSEGFFFDTDPAKVKLLVKRKDNGGTIAMLDPAVAADSALIQLFDTRPEFVVANPAQALDANNPGMFTGEIVYFFGSMPDCGVTVEAVFDEVEYVLQLRAEDETGAALNAGGFWKVWINEEDNVVENNTSTLNAHLNDTIRLDFTEAGDSKFVFVRSIINNVASTRTSFTIEDELSRTPGRVIPVTVVLRQISQNNGGNPFTLIPFSNARGNTGFMIMNSPSHPATAGTGKFATEAYAGDTVAIFPTSVTPAEYYTDGDHIRVCLTGSDDNNYIVPTPVDADNDGTVDYYTFVMPENGYDHLSVEFLPVEYTLTVNKNPADAADGLIRVVYDDGTNNDVLVNTTFKNAAFGSKVRVDTTSAGAENDVEIDIAQSIASIVPAISADDWDTWADGFWFRMPAGDTSFTVFMTGSDGTAATVPKVPVDPDPIALPATVTLNPGAISLNLQYYKSADKGAIITEAKPGETVWVEILDPTDQLNGKTIDGGKIDLLANADGKAIASVSINGDLFGSFTMPSVAMKTAADGKVVDKQYKVKVMTENAPAGCTLTIAVDGGSTYTVTPSTDGTILNPPVVHGKKITVTANDSSRNIGSIDGLKGVAGLPSMSGNGTLEPANTADGAQVEIKVKFATNMYSLTGTNVKFYDDAACTNEITEAAEDQTIYIKGAPVDQTKYVKTLKVTDADGDHVIDDGAAFKVTSNVTAAIINEAGDKAVTVKITYNNAPATLKTQVNSGEKTVGSSITVSDVKEANKDLTILLHEPGDYAFTNPGGDTGKFTATEVHTYEYKVTIDLTKVNNGDTVNVSLDIVTPNRTLPTKDKNSCPIEFYTNAAMTAESKVTTVKDGTQVYVKANVYDELYPTGIEIDGTALTAQSSGAFGPYKVEGGNLDGSKVLVSAAEKSITLVFNYKDGAAEKVDLYDGSNKQASNASITVTKSGAVKLTNVKLVTGSTFGTVKGTNVTATKSSDFKTVTFGLDFAKLANGSSVTIEVNVD